VHRIFARNMKRQTALPVFMLLGVFVLANAFFAQGVFGSADTLSSKTNGKRAGGWGGPDTPLVFDAVGPDTIFDDSPISDDTALRFVLIEKTSALSMPSPNTDAIPDGNGLMVYTVKEGDTLSTIAESFGISVDTIINANQSLKSTMIRPGQELVLLPVVGLLYAVKDGDSVQSIAEEYGISQASILEANPESRIMPGESLILPGVTPPRRALSSGSSASGLPSYPGYYALPAQGWNWGILHAQNAVDIANACGTPIFASAEGLVVESRGEGWNGGYGGYVIIEHPNGTRTRYAHTLRNAVSDGGYVSQGDVIAYIGNTGNTHGPTGCHLHFDVLGARNPFVR